MKRFINITPECELCHSELVLNKLQVDLPNCLYILFCECIVCGNNQTILLSLEDFIEINKKLFPEGGNNENYN